jgi:hypothetical protein
MKKYKLNIKKPYIPGTSRNACSYVAFCNLLFKQHSATLDELQAVQVPGHYGHFAKYLKRNDYLVEAAK